MWIILYVHLCCQYGANPAKSNIYDDDHDESIVPPHVTDKQRTLSLQSNKFVVDSLIIPFNTQ